VSTLTAAADTHSSRKVQIEEAAEDATTNEMPRVHLKLIKISGIESLAAGEVCDVLGVLDSCADWSTITRKDGTEAKKRSFVLRDDSGVSVEITLWGEKAENEGRLLFDACRQGLNPIVAVKCTPLDCSRP
jgi:replication factor A1